MQKISTRSQGCCVPVAAAEFFFLAVVGCRTLLTQHRLELSDVIIKPRYVLAILMDLLAWRLTKLLVDLPDKWHEHTVIVVNELLVGNAEGVAAITSSVAGCLLSVAGCLLIRPTKD